MKTVEANIGSSTISIGAMPVIVGSCARARFCGLGVGMGRGILLVSHIHRDFQSSSSSGEEMDKVVDSTVLPLTKDGSCLHVLCTRDHSEPQG
jgi:hypothetical protein